MFLLLFLSHKFVHVRLWSCYLWEVMSRVLLFSVVKYCLENMMIACKQALHLGGTGGGGEEIMLQHGACCHVPRWPHLVHHNWRACSYANMIKLQIMNVGTLGISLQLTCSKNYRIWNNMNKIAFCKLFFVQFVLIWSLQISWSYYVLSY